VSPSGFAHRRLSAQDTPLALAAIPFLPSLTIHSLLAIPPLYLNRTAMLFLYDTRLVTKERDNGEKRGQLHIIINIRQLF